jgi:hypothetical protein
MTVVLRPGKQLPFIMGSPETSQNAAIRSRVVPIENCLALPKRSHPVEKVIDATAIFLLC